MLSGNIAASSKHVAIGLKAILGLFIYVVIQHITMNKGALKYYLWLDLNNEL